MLKINFQKDLSEPTVCATSVLLWGVNETWKKTHPPTWKTPCSIKEETCLNWMASLSPAYYCRKLSLIIICWMIIKSCGCGRVWVGPVFWVMNLSKPCRQTQPLASGRAAELHMRHVHDQGPGLPLARHAPGAKSSTFLRRCSRGHKLCGRLQTDAWKQCGSIALGGRPTTNWDLKTQLKASAPCSDFTSK